MSNARKNKNHKSATSDSGRQVSDNAPTSASGDPQLPNASSDSLPRIETSRRRFISATSAAVMAGGLVAGYGTFAVMAGRFLYPAEGQSDGWQFVALADELAVGGSQEYVSPSGAKVVIARHGEGTNDDDFIALSSVCPHLGCRVHWEPQNNRFFCPCHNGAFDRQGKATAGPPAKAKQELIRFPVNVEEGMLFILVPLTSVTSVE